MLYAYSISLCQGISYDNVYIAEEADYQTYNIPRVFPTHAVVFWHHGKMVISHASNVRVIKIDQTRKKYPQQDNVAFNRLVLNGDIVYENGVILDPKYHAECGIPTLFQDEHKLFDQIAFTCADGVYVTHDINIASIIIEEEKRKIKSQLKI
jgi:hypothetical protein